jgi:hypothetical protein
MGLGKTLMMLANIVNGRPGKHAECKTTLLVASYVAFSAFEVETVTNRQSQASTHLPMGKGD